MAIFFHKLHQEIPSQFQTSSTPLLFYLELTWLDRDRHSMRERLSSLYVDSWLVSLLQCVVLWNYQELGWHFSMKRMEENGHSNSLNFLGRPDSASFPIALHRKPLGESVLCGEVASCLIMNLTIMEAFGQWLVIAKVFIQGPYKP